MLTWGGGIAATAVQSHSTSPQSGAGQNRSSGLSGEQPSLQGTVLRDGGWTGGVSYSLGGAGFVDRGIAAI